ncbi:hypothetical protein IT408_03590 [Candidatus Uhrbacteria bacterium]|nr:hypothetical protein [Candidatus Uhrbacteria bacterium]
MALLLLFVVIVGGVFAWNFMRRSSSTSAAILGAEGDILSAIRSGWTALIMVYERLFLPIFTSIAMVQLFSYWLFGAAMVYVEYDKLGKGEIAALVATLLFCTWFLLRALHGRVVQLVDVEYVEVELVEQKIVVVDIVDDAGVIRERMPADLALPTHHQERRERRSTDPASLATVETVRRERTPGDVALVTITKVKRERRQTDPASLATVETVRRPRTAMDPATLVAVAQARRPVLQQMLFSILFTAAIMAIVTYGVGVVTTYTARLEWSGMSVDVTHTGSRLMKVVGFIYILFFLTALSQVARFVGFIAKSGVAASEYTIQKLGQLIAAFIAEGEDGLRKSLAARPEIANEDGFDPAIKEVFLLVIASIVPVVTPTFVFESPWIIGILTILAFIVWGVLIGAKWYNHKYGYSWAVKDAEATRKRNFLFLKIFTVVQVVWFLLDIAFEHFAPVAYWRMQQAFKSVALNATDGVAGGIESAAQDSITAPKGMWDWLYNLFHLPFWPAILTLAVASAIIYGLFKFENVWLKRASLIPGLFAAAAAFSLLMLATGFSSPNRDLFKGSPSKVPPTRSVISRSTPTPPSFSKTMDDEGRTEVAGSASKRNPYLDEHCKKFGCTPSAQ